MKILGILCIALMTSICYAQDKTVNLSELDSFSGKSNTKAFQVIENVPVYKGCENKKGNSDRKQCMSDKIGKLVTKNFNTTLHKDSNIEPGIKRIYVIFKIDENGDVIDIDSRAQDKFLEDEAKRVTNLIPKMIPGRQKGKPVIVPYSLPILVKMNINPENLDSTYPVFRGCNKESSNSALQECSKEKIRNFIKMSYDLEMASRALPLEKSTKFLLEFTINKKGKIEHVNAKANHKSIAIEAIKVAKRLPKFKAPGMLNGVPVDTPYELLMTLYF